MNLICMSMKLECNTQYIGESSRASGERKKENLRSPFPICDHANTSGHHTKRKNFSVVGRKSHTIARTITEAMFIRGNYPFLNRNISNYQLTHTRDEVLFNTPDLHLKEAPQANHAHNTRPTTPVYQYPGGPPCCACINNFW